MLVKETNKSINFAPSAPDSLHSASLHSSCGLLRRYANRVMKIIATTIALLLISANVWADAACVKSEEASRDHSGTVEVRAFKITKSEYSADITGPKSLSDVTVHSITVYRGTKDKHTLAFPLAFQTDSDNFSAWLVGYPNEFKGLTVNIRYWGDGKCAVDIAKPLRITSKG